MVANVDEKDIETFYRNVAKQIARVRKEKNISQSDLANIIGSKYKSVIAGAECGYKNVRFNLKHLYLISIALNVDVSEFFKFKEEIMPGYKCKCGCDEFVRETHEIIKVNVNGDGFDVIATNPPTLSGVDEYFKPIICEECGCEAKIDNDEFVSMCNCDINKTQMNMNT